MLLKAKADLLPVHADKRGPFLVMDQPASIGSFAFYPGERPDLKKRLGFINRFKDKVTLYRETPGGVLVPRALAPLGVIDHRSPGTKFTFESKMKPRNEEQRRVILEAGKLLLAGESFIIEAPTGFGKTAVACDLIAWTDVSTCVVVPKDDLMEQWRAELARFLNLPLALIGTWRGDKVPSNACPVVVAMLQSIYRLERYPAEVRSRFGLVVFDEVHRLGADQFSQAVFGFPARLRLGLSATPKRQDGKDAVFHAHIGPVRVVASIPTMVPKVLRLRSPWKRPVRKQVTNGVVEYVPAEPMPGQTTWVDKTLTRNKGRNAVIVAALLILRDKKRNVVVFAETIEHLERLRNLAVAAGIPADDCRYFVGGMSKAEQAAAKVAPVVFATYQMVSEGTNVPRWDACILTTPKSHVEQPVGRILREMEGKKQPIVFDVVDHDSKVYSGYAERRLAYYQKMGAAVKWSTVDKPA